MKRTLMLGGLAAAIACGSSAGDMMGETFDDMTDVPDAGAQPTDCTCEAGSQGEPGPRGEPGQSGAPVLFCAEFGAFCGFSPGTFASTTECQEGVAELSDDALTCTVRNLEAAKSGDDGGCAAIAGGNPCGFTPMPVQPERPQLVDARALTFPNVSGTPIFTTQCGFDDSAAFSVQDGERIFAIVNSRLYTTINSAPNFNLSVALRKDGTTETIVQTLNFRTYSTAVSLSALTEPLSAGSYEVGICLESLNSDSAYSSQGLLDSVKGTALHLRLN